MRRGKKKTSLLNRGIDIGIGRHVATTQRNGAV